jgi:hypothetical protein
VRLQPLLGPRLFLESCTVGRGLGVLLQLAGDDSTSTLNLEKEKEIRYTLVARKHTCPRRRAGLSALLGDSAWDRCEAHQQAVHLLGRELDRTPGSKELPGG